MRTDTEILVDVERKIDVIRENIHDLELTQIDIKKDLSYHIKRTDVLEDEVLHLAERIKPIESIRFTWQNILKLVAFFTAISALGTTVVAVLDYFKIINH
jgi:hypothetical protein